MMQSGSFKASKYNIIFENENRHYIYNTFRDSLLEVDQETIAFVHDCSKDWCRNSECSEAVIDVLFQNGIIVDESKDELAELKVRNRLGRFYVNSLSLTIAPTLMCNFNCDYCFEGSAKTSMTQRIMDAVYDFTLVHLKDKNSLGITWYGGEPLLAMNKISYLSTKFIRLCETMGIKYSADIISNGYLMSRRNAKILTEQLAVDNWQVTIDGTREIHDARRTLRNGKGTFDRILKNILENVDLFQRVFLRVNIDSRNWEKVPDLLDVLDEKGLTDRISVSVTKVEPFTEICHKIEKFCLRKEDFAGIFLKLSRSAAEKGFDITINPKLYGNYCTADCMDSFVIDANGDISKCWNSVGRRQERIGSVLQKEKNDTYIRWLSYDPFEREKCKGCKFMPICMGGCPYSVLYENSQETCQQIRYMLPEMLSLKMKYGFFEEVISDEGRCRKKSAECDG